MDTSQIIEWAKHNPDTIVKISPYGVKVMATTPSYTKDISHYILEDGTPLIEVVSKWYLDKTVVVPSHETKPYETMTEFTAAEMKNVPPFMNFQSCYDGQTISYIEKGSNKTTVKYTPIQRTYGICKYLFDMFPTSLAVITIIGIDENSRDVYMMTNDFDLIPLNIEPFLHTDLACITRYGFGLTINEINDLWLTNRMDDILKSLSESDSIGRKLWEPST